MRRTRLFQQKNQLRSSDRREGLWNPKEAIQDIVPSLRAEPSNQDHAGLGNNHSA